MADNQNKSNNNQNGSSGAFNKQLPPSQTSTPMPKVQPPKKDGK
jgi:hypothetical protein